MHFHNFGSTKTNNSKTVCVTARYQEVTVDPATENTASLSWNPQWPKLLFIDLWKIEKTNKLEMATNRGETLFKTVRKSCPLATKHFILLSEVPGSQLVFPLMMKKVLITLKQLILKETCIKHKQKTMLKVSTCTYYFHWMKSSASQNCIGKRKTDTHHQDLPLFNKIAEINARISSLF